MKESLQPKNAIMGIAITLLLASSSIGIKEALVSFGIGNALAFGLSLPLTLILIFGYSYSLIVKKKEYS